MDVAAEGYATVLLNCVAVTLVFLALSGLPPVLDRRLLAGLCAESGYGKRSTGQ